MRGNRVHPGVALTGQSTVPRIPFTMENHNLARIAVCLWLAAFALVIAIVFWI